MLPRPPRLCPHPNHVSVITFVPSYTVACSFVSPVVSSASSQPQSSWSPSPLRQNLLYLWMVHKTSNAFPCSARAHWMPWIFFCLWRSSTSESLDTVPDSPKNATSSSGEFNMLYHLEKLSHRDLIPGFLGFRLHLLMRCPCVPGQGLHKDRRPTPLLPIKDKPEDRNRKVKSQS